MDNVSNLAQEVIFDLSNPPNLTEAYVASWFKFNIGELNVALDTCFTVDMKTGQIIPPMCDDVKCVFKTRYLANYYYNQMRQAMGAGGYLSGNDQAFWTNVKEGDSSITRANPNDIIKTFKSIGDQARLDADAMAKRWRMNKNNPQQVVGDDTVAGGYYNYYYATNLRNYPYA